MPDGTDNTSAPPVLATVMRLEGNHYATLMNEAWRAAGADVVQFRRSSVFARRRHRPALVHVQWPERWLQRSFPHAARQSMLMTAYLAVARLRGARIMITAHNVDAHEPRHPVLQRILWASLSVVVTDVHLLTEAGADAFFEQHPALARRTRHVIPHVNYRTSGALPDRSTARESLGVAASGAVLAHVGAIKAYKGVPQLIRAFREVPSPTTSLVIAGRVTPPELEHELSEAAADDLRIRFRPGWLDDDDLQNVIAAADWVVLPYRSILNSGTVLQALSLDRPVLVPATPTFLELRHRVGADWVRVYDGELAPEDLSALGTPPSGRPDLAFCDPAAVAGHLADLLQRQLPATDRRTQ